MTLEKVIAIIVDRLGVPEIDVVPRAHITKDLGADSLDVVELGMEVEKEFNITLKDDDVEEISDVQSLVDLINKEIEKKG